MNYCPNCGSALKENPIYCPNCGQKLVHTPNEGTQTKETRQQIKKKMEEARNNELGSGILGIILGIGGLSFVIQRTVTIGDMFNFRVFMIDRSAIYGVIAIILGIILTGCADQYRRKHKELKNKLED
jgi:DNA-directed RNA polymerase subunit RPC12/RpoP